MPTSIELTIRLDSYIRAVPIAIDGVSGVISPYNPVTVVVSPPNLQGACQPTIDAFDGSQAAQDAWQDDLNKSQAKKYMVLTTDLGKSYRSVAAIMVDELNSLRGWIMSFKAAVASATSLADLKTRVAALPDLPDRTLLQAKTAFIDKVNSGV
jgi:hypothetical protein